VVFVGVDGAGKSTLIRRVKEWLSWKIDICVIYFGSGEGMSSLLRYPLTKFVSLVKRKKAKEKIIKKNNISNTNKVDESNEIVKSEKAKKSVAYRLFKVIWAITLGFEKKSKFKRLWKAKEQGLIVICDRYPQIQVMGFNDGPLLNNWMNSRNKMKRKIARWEYNIYKLCNVYNPDILIKLKIPEEISCQRKPETPIKIIKDKIDAVEKIKYNTNTQIYSIDTDEEIEKVLLKIKKIIWKY
jgi:thymidylate kinase